MTTHNKIVHFLRPGEALEENGAFDSPLSRKAEQAANDIIKKLPSVMRAPTLVLAPPLKHCMQTALTAFHPDFNNTLHRIASDNNEENMDSNEVMQHFAKGNVKFMLDPRLDDLILDWRRESDGPIRMPSRLDMLPMYKKYFIFPEEFYPKYEDGQDYDPDENQDWYKQEGLWTRGWHSLESLERAAAFKEFLYNRPEKEIIVITEYYFFQALIGRSHHGSNRCELSSYIWKPTVSETIRLVPLTSPESQKDILEDDDYLDYWPYILYGRSELFHKWYRKPLIKILEIFLGFEERKKYLGMDRLTLESLEAELGPEVVQEVKNGVRGAAHYCL